MFWMLTRHDPLVKHTRLFLSGLIPSQDSIDKAVKKEKQMDCRELAQGRVIPTVHEDVNRDD